MIVNIPSDFFLNEAKHEYYDYKSRLVCEVIQNSVDAGATRISMDFGEDSMSFCDNGSGMTQDRMVAAMLTMGGSVKKSGNTGGFGAAKKLLLFSHREFEIHSLETFVRGSCLNYEFVEAEYFYGTKIKVSPLESFSYRPSEMRDLAKTFLKKCNFKHCEVYLDGELFSEYLDLPVIRDNESMCVCSSPESSSSGYIYVRKNGLFMFDRYVPKLTRQVTCEIKGDSKEVFSQSRDSLKGPTQRLFDNIVSELSIDKLSFFRTGLRKHFFRGKKSVIQFFNSFVKESGDSIPDFEKDLFLTSRELLASFREVSEARGYLKSVGVSESTIALLEKKQSEERIETEYDFLIDLADSDVEEIPKHLNPKTMQKKYRDLALTWKHCILKVCEIMGYDCEFGIGFTLNNGAEAIFSNKGSVNQFLINPNVEEYFSKVLKERFFKILFVAIHELVHCIYGLAYHDERFSSTFEDVCLKVMLNLEDWRSVVKTAKKDSL
jgi:hypothetical protein